MRKCDETPLIGGARSFFIRPTVIAGNTLPDDYIVRQDFRDIGRIRFAPELSSLSAVWDWKVTIPVPTPSWCGGIANSLDEAKAAFNAAWLRFRPTLTEHDIRSWLDH